MGQNFAEGYIEVSAQAANNGISLYNATSTGTAVGGYWVNWDIDSGFTGRGWWPAGTFESGLNSITIAKEGSPVASLENEAAVREYITSVGNLDYYFSNWNHPDKLSWVTAMHYAGCANPS